MNRSRIRWWHAAWLLIVAVPTLAETPPVAKLAAQLEQGDRDSRREAARALSELGREAKAALPQLIRGARDRDPQIWEFSILAIDRLGEDAAQAVDVLLKQLGEYHPQRRYRVSVALGHIGRPALEGLQAALTSKNTRVRASAADALGVMGPPAAPAAKVLGKLLDDRDESVRRSAARALGRIGKPALPTLQSQLKSFSAHARTAAAWAVRVLGSAASTLQSQLVELCGDEDAGVRVAAMPALIAVGPVTEDQSRVLLKGLQDPDSRVRESALNAIAATKTPDPFLAGLLELAEDGPLAVRRDAVFLLGRHGRGREDVVRTLLRTAAAEPALRDDVVGSLVRMGRAAVPALLAELSRRSEAADVLTQALGKIGGAARAALLESLDASQAAVRANAATALGRLSLDPDTQRRLAALLADREGSVRSAAVKALAQHASDLKRAEFDSLLKLAQDPDRQVRVALTDLLAALDPESSSVRTTVDRLLADSEPAVHRAVLRVLAQWDELPEPTARMILKRLPDADPETRSELLALAARHASLLAAGEAELRRAARAAAQDTHPAARRAAARFYGRFAASDRAAQLELARLIADKDSDVALAALEAVPRVESVAPELWSAVVGRVASGSEPQRVAAIRTMRRAGRSAERKLDVLLKALKDDEWSVRSEACRALGALGADGKRAVPDLLALLYRNEDQDAARQALQRIGTAGPDAVPQLKKMLRDRNRRRRAYAVYLLGRIEPPPVQVLSELKKLQGRGDERFQRLLRSTIERIERTSKAERR